MQGQHIPNQVGDIFGIVKHIATINLDDGLSFVTPPDGVEQDGRCDGSQR